MPGHTQYPDRRPKNHQKGGRSPIKKGRAVERRAPPPINKEYVIGEINDAMDAQFNGIYSWENMVRDSGLNKAEQKWAKDHLHYRIVEIGKDTIPYPVISHKTYEAAKEFVDGLEGEMHSGGMSSNNEWAENGLRSLMELMSAAKKAGLVNQHHPADPAVPVHDPASDAISSY
jgi:hypothetical protein